MIALQRMFSGQFCHLHSLPIWLFVWWLCQSWDCKFWVKVCVVSGCWCLCHYAMFYYCKLHMDSNDKDRERDCDWVNNDNNINWGVRGELPNKLPTKQIYLLDLSSTALLLDGWFQRSLCTFVSSLSSALFSVNCGHRHSKRAPSQHSNGHADCWWGHVRARQNVSLRV